MKLFVYGTLKKGFYNHSWLRNSSYLGDYSIPGFTLYDTGYGYPAAVRKEKSYIMGETYEVDEYTYRAIQRMEIGASYQEETIDGYSIFTFTKDTLNQTMQSKEIGEVWK